MKAAFRIAALSVFLIVSTTVEAGDAPRTVPTVRFDRVQGVVVSSNPEARTVDVRLPGGGTQRLRIAGNAWLHTLRGLDERERMLDPKGLDAFQPGVRIAASGLVYSDAPELVAKEVSLLSGPDGAPVYEGTDWWASQARELAEFWIRTQFGEGDIGDPSGYRTDITKTGTKRPETINLQENDTISRLIYGLSSTYILNGNPRVLQAARELVRYQRERMRIESADGRMYESRNRVTLCRCGKSENKPYCDGSHWMNSEQRLEFRKKWGLGGF